MSEHERRRLRSLFGDFQFSADKHTEPAPERTSAAALATFSSGLAAHYRRNGQQPAHNDLRAGHAGTIPLVGNYERVYGGLGSFQTGALLTPRSSRTIRIIPDYLRILLLKIRNTKRHVHTLKVR